MYNHSKAQQSKNRVHISWDKLYTISTSNLIGPLGTNWSEIWNEISDFHLKKRI